MKESVTLAFVGDVMLGRGVNEEISRSSPESFWGNVLPMYGLRSHQNKALIQELEESAKKISETCELGDEI